MKITPFLFFISVLLLSARPDNSFARAPAAPEAQAEASKDTPPALKKKRLRRKSVNKDPAAGAEQPPAAARPAEPKKVNSLLFGTMERLETLGALYDNLRLQVSADTLARLSEMQKASNKVAAGYFRVEGPASGEAPENYRAHLDRALKSVKALKDVKDRVKPEESEAAILLCRDLNAAIDGELAGAKLTAPGPTAEPAGQEGEQAAPAEASVTNEAAALAALSEVRKVLEAYKTKETKYPKSLAKLAPKYISAIPEIQLADHPATREVLVIDSSDYDEAAFQAITDTGKWLYFTDKKSKYYGSVFIDCSHKDAAGTELYKAGQGN